LNHAIKSFDLAEFFLVAFVVLTILFLLVELMSLVAGVQLTRSITGAVHELYLGTRRIQQGDFGHRIRSKAATSLPNWPRRSIP